MSLYFYDDSTGDLSGPGGSEGTYPDAAAAAAHLATLGEVFEILAGQSWSVRPSDHTHDVGQISPLRLDYLRDEAKAAGVPVNARETDAGVQFFGSSDLSDADRSTLDGVASAHTGEFQAGDAAALRIGRHLSPPQPALLDPPLDLDFGKLAPKLHKRIGARDAWGYVTRWDWLPITNGVRGPQVVCEHHAYQIPFPNAAPISREVTLEWQTNGGTSHPTIKKWRKWYDTAESIAKEGKLRRGKLMDEAQGVIYAWLLGSGLTFADGQAFVAAIKAETDRYVDYSDPAVLTSIAGTQGFSWLDQAGAFDSSMATPVIDGSPPTGVLVTPRQYLLGVLNTYA